MKGRHAGLSEIARDRSRAGGGEPAAGSLAIPAEASKRRRPPAPRIGKKLHAIRKARGLTLEQLQNASGISKSMLSQIERGRASPTFATLWHLTQALGVEIGELISKVKSVAGGAREMEHMRVHSTPSVTSGDGKVRFSILNPMRFALPIEWYDISLAPGGGHRANPHGNGSWEHMTCVGGQIVVEVGDEDITLHEGETLRYMAEVPHGIRNDSKRAARALLIVIPLHELDAAGPFWNGLDPQA